MDQFNEVNPKKRSAIADSAILTAFVTFSGYLLAFAYQAGYGATFNIPTYFIALNLVSIIQASLFASVILILIGFLMYAAFPLINSFGTALWQRFWRYAVLAFMVTGIILGTPRARWYGFHIWMLFAGISILASSDFIVPIISERKTKGYFDKLIAYDLRVEEQSAKKPSFLRYIVSKMGPELLVIGPILIAILNIGNIGGRLVAVNQKSFLVKDSDLVVLRKYGDILICAKVDLVSKTVSTKFVFINIANVSANTFELQSIGPLSAQYIEPGLE